MTSRKILTLVLGLAAFGAYGVGARAADDAGTVRATLPNGMRVVIIRNSLAPVVTVQTNFIVGGDETPAGISGDGARGGAYGVPRMHGDDRGPDGGDLRADGRRE